MNHCSHLFRLLSVLLSAYLLLCLCCIILNTSSAEQHRRHHSHHTFALHRHHPHHRSRNNHHHHLIISSRSNSGGWQGKTPWGNRTPRPLLPKPVGLNNLFQRITLLPLPSHSGQPRPPRPHPHPQGPPPPPPPPLPPRPGQQRQQCGENAEWVHNCKQARKVFNAAKYQRGNGCFATTCTSYLATRGNQQGDFRRWSGCFCLPSHVWLDQEVGQPPAQGAAPGQPGGRCVLPARCPAVERHLSSTPMKLSFTWTKGIARYRQWKAKKMAAGAWRSPIKPGETYVNDQRAVATSRWLVHFLALHEEDRFVRVYPEPNWPILELNVCGQATLLGSLSLSYLPSLTFLSSSFSFLLPFSGPQADAGQVRPPVVEGLFAGVPAQSGAANDGQRRSHRPGHALLRLAKARQRYLFFLLGHICYFSLF